MSKYAVGQVLYVVSSKQMNVFPIFVVEELTKKRVDGTETTHVVQLGEDPEKTAKIDDIDGEVFESSEAVRKHLLENVTNTVNKMVHKAVARSREWYPGTHEGTTDPLEGITKNKQKNQQKAPAPQSGKMQVELEDGTVANVTVGEPRTEE